MTLPRAMVGLFPESGEIVALDTRSDTEHILTAVDQRTVTGLGPLFKKHRMAVNDELVIRPLEDGRFAFTAVKREQRPDYSSGEALRGVLDELLAASVPVTEAEVRALYQGIPDDVDLAELFASDERFVLREGRWHNALSLAFGQGSEGGSGAVPGGLPAHASTGSPAADAVTGQAEYAAVGAPASPAEAAAAATSAAPTGFTADAVSDSATSAGTGQHAGDDDGRLTSLHAAPAPSAVPHDLQAGLWQPDVESSPNSGAHGAAGGRASERAGERVLPGSVIARRQPGPAPRHRSDSGSQETGLAEESDEDQYDDGASLEVTELSNRLRGVLAPMGFRIEPVARAQLLLTADMGRRSYKVLTQLLTRNDRVDWADLLARRRTTGVRYLAVVGDVRALHRLTNPAELARATMWSWQALDRLATLRQTVSFSPIELESHFERDGLFEKGLERFEAAVAKRVSERGVVSELLSRLALMRAPTVFLLEDLAGELDLPRDRLLALLEMLSGAPFHLVAKVDQGEFVLRQRVADSLENLASYATSLRARLPTKSVEKLTGLAEPDLLTDDELDDHTANDAGSGTA